MAYPLAMNIIRIFTRIFIVPVLALAFSGPAAADKISLAALSAYFNDMTSAVAGFTQINDDGSISTGQILIRRPGHIRFEYSAPNDSLVMAGGGANCDF
ncbi:MAG: LolA family protein [Paracoccaceae bacterium]